MQSLQDEQQDDCALSSPSVLHDLINLGQTHFDIFTIINGFLDADTWRAIAGSCRSARALWNAAVNAIELCGSTPPPLERDLADVFPHAMDLYLNLLEDENGKRCDSFSAALKLQDWSGATPRLLSQLTSLSLAFDIAVMMDTDTTTGFHSAMVDVIGRWVCVLHHAPS
jgi:hypothetical protein